MWNETFQERSLSSVSSLLSSLPSRMTDMGVQCISQNNNEQKPKEFDEAS